MSIQKKPTLQEWFQILAFAVSQLKNLFGSKQWKGRLAKQNEQRIEVLEEQIKTLLGGLEAAGAINSIQQSEIDELKAEVARLKDVAGILAEPEAKPVRKKKSEPID
jgi:hypothetical protein